MRDYICVGVDTKNQKSRSYWTHRLRTSKSTDRELKSMVRYKLTYQVSREGWEFSTGHSALLRWSPIISYDPSVVMKRHQSVEETWQRCCGLPGGQHLAETSLTDIDLQAQGLVPNKPLTEVTRHYLSPFPVVSLLILSTLNKMSQMECVSHSPAAISHQCREHKLIGSGHAP